ncbi:Serine/threonine protein kinase [Labilithrix luteola]|uniref:Serine/threonine protein kinase n=2 Tax=Labilithrix luteola TaxID=1391654 RepID=A0A0K1QDU7_9BACT|nr:Serine/threonine protein kinase [Labilithrix luteola]
MGKVWVAEHLSLHTDVVVKFMAKEVTEEADALSRFSREASAAAAVKSPHVVQMFDHGVMEDGVPYIVMELLEGQDLAAHLARHGRMAPTDVAALVIQVAKALHKAHQVGVIHRDIKPENIFLCDGEAGDVFVKLLDFGVAKRSERSASKTTTGQVLGTPYYMSPEQILGENIDARTDIWSLGVVAFEALTGKRPFDGATVGAITLAIHANRPCISAHIPDPNGALDRWFAKACARDVSQRFATAREAAQALSAAAGDPRASQALIRATMTSLVGEGTNPSIFLGPDGLATGAAGAPTGAIDEGRGERDRVATSLSATFSVPSSKSRRSPLVFVVAAAAALVGIVGAAAFVALRKDSSETAKAAATAASPGTAASASETPASSAAAATAAETPANGANVGAAAKSPSGPTAGDPVAPPATKSAVSSAKGKAAPSQTSMGSFKPRPPPRKRDDDDIK